jgi:hypothetical protein
LALLLLLLLEGEVVPHQEVLSVHRMSLLLLLLLGQFALLLPDCGTLVLLRACMHPGCYDHCAATAAAAAAAAVVVAVAARL